MPGTNINDTLEASRPRKKQFLRKVTTGCATCRARRLKCDEYRPSCLRCLKIGTICPGYIAESTSLHNSKPLEFEILTPQMMAPTSYRSSKEANDLSFFLQQSAPMISMASGSTELWTVIIPQVSWEFREVREMLYAVSCFDQNCVSSATNIDLDGPHKTALEHFNKAIRGLTRGTPSLHNILLSSLLGWMFEITKCNFAAAKIHIDAAQRIVRENDERDRSRGRPPDYDTVIEAVRAVEFDPHWREFKALQDEGYSPEDLPKMTNIEEAWTSLEDITREFKVPGLDSAAVARGRRRMLLWRIACIEAHFDLGSDTSGVPMSARRPVILLHTMGSVCLELQTPRESDTNVSRRKRWDCVLNDSEKILDCDYGYRIENGVRMLLDIVLAQADPELSLYQRACRLRQRLTAD